jgi:hypothetical protein
LATAVGCRLGLSQCPQRCRVHTNSGACFRAKVFRGPECSSVSNGLAYPNLPLTRLSRVLETMAGGHGRLLGFLVADPTLCTMIHCAA